MHSIRLHIECMAFWETKVTGQMSMITNSRFHFRLSLMADRMINISSYSNAFNCQFTSIGNMRGMEQWHSWLQFPAKTFV